MRRVLMSGASGLIGSALGASLEAQGYDLYHLVRRPVQSSREREYRPDQPISATLISGIDIVIHLAGENIAGRWTPAKKNRIRESRVLSTRNLSQALVSADERPQVFVCASAIGYYGDQGDKMLTETSSSQAGFLATLCQEWEEATRPARELGIRTVNLRIGVVLSPRAGALKAMLAPFRLGLGGKIGTGRQWWSWIHMTDLVRAVLYILQSERLAGPVNLTAPEPVTNKEFTQTLARTLKRPALLPVPAWLMGAVLGEFAREGLLSSTRVLPNRLIESGFVFQFPELAAALTDLLA